LGTPSYVVIANILSNTCW